MTYEVLGIKEREYRKLKDYIGSNPEDALNNFFDIQKMLTGWEKELAIISQKEEWHALFSRLLEAAANPFAYYFCFSFLATVTKDAGLWEDLIVRTYQDDALTTGQKQFLYFQYTYIFFLFPACITEKSKNIMVDLYTDIYETYKSHVKIPLQFIPKEERNKDLVFVLTTQMLNLNHGPTKTVLDRCEVLEKTMGKRVVIIDTCESFQSDSWIPFYCLIKQNSNDELAKEETLAYNGREYMYVQLESNSDLEEAAAAVLEFVCKNKPYFILNIGGLSVISDICSNVVPTVCLSTVFSGRAVTRGQFQIVGRPLGQEDEIWRKQHELPEDHLVESLFTFSFKEQAHTYSRKELGLPENQFLVVLVGGRLDDEIDEDLEAVMERLMQQGIAFVFVGFYSRLEMMRESRPVYKTMAYDLGWQDDVLAVDECCNLYLNPRRLGGGTTVVEAMSKGLPAVVMDYGDVGVTAGPDFHVKDYEDMYQTILRYATDAEFYDNQSKKAYARASRLLDSAGEFQRVIRKIEESPRF